MKPYLRIVAAVIAAGSLALWAGLGRNTGWTKTSVTEMRVDPVTTLEFPVTEKRFVPGVDALAVALAAAAGVFGASFLFRSQSNLKS